MSAFEMLHTELTKLSKQLLDDADKHRRLSQIETVQDTWTFKILTPLQGSTIHTDKKYGSLVQRLLTAQVFDPIGINDVLPDEPCARYRYLKRLKDSGIVIGNGRDLMVLYTRSYGNNTESLHYAWLIPANEDVDEDRTRKAQRHCEQQAPVYFTRQLKRKFIDTANSMGCETSKAKLRRLYAVATGDASASRSKKEAEIDQRVMNFIELEDDSIIMDLRSLNHQEGKFDVFFDAASTVLQQEIETAVDDRRQDTVVHLAKAFSANDLFK